MLGLDHRRLAGNGGGHGRVPVPVAADPGPEPQERRHRRRRRPAGRAEQHLVERPVDAGHEPEQRLVERRHHRADLVKRGHPGHPELRRPPQQVDLLAQPPPQLGGAGRHRGARLHLAREVVVDRGEQPADAAERGDDRAAARLGRVRGEHRVHDQLAKQRVQVGASLLGGDPLGRVGQRLARRRVARVAAAQGAHPLLLFGQVDQVKVDREGARDLLRAVTRPGPDQRRDRVGGLRRRRRRPVGHPPGVDHRVPQPLDVRQQVRAAGLADHLAEHVAEQPDIAPHGLGKLGRISDPVVSGHVHVDESNRQVMTPTAARLTFPP